MSPRRVATVLLSALLGVSLLPGAAAASHTEPATSCAYAAGVVEFAVRGNRNGTPVPLDVLPTGEIRLGGVPCGAATVTNTDTVYGTGDGDIRIDLAHPFAPGATPEPDGLAEIEFVLLRSPGRLWVAGGPGPDDIRRADGGLHLNGDADHDITYADDQFLLYVDGGDGDDVIDLAPRDGGPRHDWPYTVYGGAGDDVVRGHETDDFFYGGPGADQYVPGPGSDLGYGQAGDDVILETSARRYVGAGAAVPDAGTASSTVPVAGGELALDVEVRVTLVHPDTSALTLRLARGADEVVLASGQPGAGYVGTLFDDDAAPGTGSGTHTGRFRPSGGTLAALLGGDARGAWTLSVDDAAADGQAVTLVEWSVHVVGTDPEHARAYSGWDILQGDDGIDTISFAAKDAVRPAVRFTGADGSLQGGDDGEDDRLHSFDVVIGSIGDDVFYAPGDKPTRFVTLGGDDTVTVGAGDVVECGAGADTLDLSTAYYGGVIDLTGGPGVTVVDGCEQVTGTEFADTFLGTSGADTIIAGPGDDTVYAGGGADQVTGGTGADTLAGGPGGDTVSGGAGDDVLVEGDTAGPNGADVLRGESGTDVVTYDGRTAGVVVTLDNVAGDGAPGEADNAGGIESAVGTDSNDVLVGNDAVNHLRGLGGNDTLRTGAGADAVEGGEGDDAITGGDGDDVLSGGAGADTFLEEAAASGADDLSGGPGTDTVDYRARSAALTVDVDGAAGDGESQEGDNVRTDVERVLGGAGGDRLTGGAGPDALFGYGGEDVVDGGAGADLLDGGAGSDLLLARDGVADTLLGGDGVDAALRDPVDAASGVEVLLP